MDRHIFRVWSRCLPDTCREEAIPGNAQEGPRPELIESFSFSCIKSFASVFLVPFSAIAMGMV